MEALALPRSTADSLSPFSTSNKPALDPTPNQSDDAHLTDEEQTLKQTGTDNTSLRNIDFPRTFISKIPVDLTSPYQWVTLTWSGSNARLQPTTRYHSSPGRGLGNNNCDDPAESCRVNSNCTPKGTRRARGQADPGRGRLTRPTNRKESHRNALRPTGTLTNHHCAARR